MTTHPRLIEIKAIIRRHMLENVIDALHGYPNLPGVTISEVTGVGHIPPSSGERARFGDARMLKLEIVVPEIFSETVRDLISEHARTGQPGDGIIFSIPVESATRVRTGKDPFMPTITPDDAPPE